MAQMDLRHLMLMLVLCGSCGPAEQPEPADEGPTAEVEEFGLPSGKSDTVDCDPTSRLCWSLADRKVVQRVLVAEDDVIRSESLDGPATDRYLEQIDRLRHKLTDEETAALDKLEKTAEDPAVFVRDVRERVLHRVVLGYMTAHTAGLGRDETGAVGKADESSGVAYSDGLSEGMVESLTTLSDRGAFGTIYAFLFEHTGVLSREYTPASDDWRAQPPVALRAEEVVSDSMWAQARSSAIANLESLVPVAGIVISIPHGMLMTFRVRARMVLELAAVHGIDIRRGQNLLLAAASLMSASELPEVRALLGASFAAPWLIRRAATLFDVPSVENILRLALVRTLERFWPAVGRVGRAILERVGIEAVAEGTARQLASYVTFGVAMLAEIALDVVGLERVGANVRTVMHPWGSNMLLDHTEFMSTAGGRDCATKFLADAAGVDGGWSPEEIGLLTAHVGRSVWVDGTWEQLNSEAQMLRQARIAVDYPAGEGLPDCVDDAFVGIDAADRLTLLSWYRTVNGLDGAYSDIERARYGEVVDALAGDSWWGDGEALDDVDVAAMESRVDAVFVDRDALLGEEALPEGGELSPSEVLTRLDEPYPAAQAAVECAMRGDC